jgi:hypothetical protein
MDSFLSGNRGRLGLMAVAVLAVAGILWLVWADLKSNPSLDMANDPIFINAETGKVFHLKVTAGMSYPVICPDTGKATGYEAELCYWTKDGHVKDDPTPVLLNSVIGQPGPTFCPDCGRLVVVHNPPAVEGHKPPPTKDEYLAAQATKTGSVH